MIKNVVDPNHDAIKVTADDSQVTKQAENCEELAPYNTRSSRPQVERTLNFKDKGLISHGKYGFISSFKVKKRTLVRLYLLDGSEMSNTKYGIYRDKKLEECVDEVDMRYNMDAYGAMEEGADLSEYPDYQDGIAMVLELGNYLFVVYTTSSADKMVCPFESDYVVLPVDIELKEGKTARYVILNKNDTVFTKLVATRTGKIRVKTDAYYGELQLLDEDKHPISLIVTPKKHKTVKATFEIKKGSQYYISIRHSEVVTLSDMPVSGIGGWPIRYDYVT